jgi:hypothetical protein
VAAQKRPRGSEGDAVSLGEDEVRHLLRECVTVVKPGEVLVIRVPGLTPEQLYEYNEAVKRWLGDLAPGVRSLVTIGEELGVAEALEPAWLREVREETFRTEQVDTVRLTHLPTGIVAEGRDHDAVVTGLAQALLGRGKISVNDARAAHRLPPLHPEPVMPAGGAGGHE